MKHYKEGRNHIFEFGEMSITRIKLKQSQYEELVNYFTQQQVKNLNIPAVMGELTCDSCGCHPNVIYTTSKGRFCQRCKPAS